MMKTITLSYQACIDMLKMCEIKPAVDHLNMMWIDASINGDLPDLFANSQHPLWFGKPILPDSPGLNLLSNMHQTRYATKATCQPDYRGPPVIIDMHESN